MFDVVMHPAEPHVTVVVPTYERRDLLLRCLGALAGQTWREFDVVVVVDGSSDGTAAALRSLKTAFTLTVLEQSNQGLAATRNRGAAVASGDLLLFLDDDMEADPELLREHVESHRAGADAVFGAMPLHPDSPTNLIADGVGRWAELFAAELGQRNGESAWHEVLGGQLSVRRATFAALGGFDPSFARRGSYGNEDLDFGYRLTRAGFRIRFNPRARSFQRYVVRASQHLRQMYDVGRADVLLIRKHPEIATELIDAVRCRDRATRMLRTPVCLAPWLFGGLVRPVQWPIERRIAQGRLDRWTRYAFALLRAVHYWRGVHHAGGVPKPRTVRVLCYHSVADLAHEHALKPYGMPPARFVGHLDLLGRLGWHFIDIHEFLRYLHHGAGLPSRPLLLTFDDGYRDFLETALPILRARAIPAVVFVVTRYLGQTNVWDAALSRRPLQLLSASELHECRAGGMWLGIHSRTHRPLESLSPDQIADEVQGAVQDALAQRFPAPLAFAYPHGTYSSEVVEITQRSGVTVAFTVDEGYVNRSTNPYLVPRLQILRDDSGLRLITKLVSAGRVPLLLRRLAGRLTGVLTDAAQRLSTPHSRA